MKKNKDGSVKKILTFCRVGKSEYTSNSALKFYLKDRLTNKKGNQKDILTNLTLEEKIISACEISNEKTGENEFVWKADKDGRILIVYQTNEINAEGVLYNARSFEDAFFHINRKMFTGQGENDEKKAEKCAEKFQGLKKTELFFDDTQDSFDLAEKCVNKKPSLAMDILLNSESNGEQDFINWQVPQYIREGLEWLQKD